MFSSRGKTPSLLLINEDRFWLKCEGDLFQVLFILEDNLHEFNICKIAIVEKLNNEVMSAFIKLRLSV